MNIKNSKRRPRIMGIVKFFALVFFLFVPFISEINTRAAECVSPANPNASYETKQFLNYIYSLPSRTTNKVLSGQYVVAWDINTNDAGKLYKQTGHWPAILGADYYHQNIRNYIDSGYTVYEKYPIYEGINQMMKAYWNNGGLVQITIHATNPESGKYYKEGSRITLENVVEPGHPTNVEWMKHLSIIADALDDLQEAGVVVLWRPYHEMCSNFWWGMGKYPEGNPELFNKLWKQMFDYFTYERHLNNLIWVYTSGGCFPTYYPSIADYVDITGNDYYGINPAGAKWAQNSMSNLSGKPFAFTEFGPYSWDPAVVQEKVSTEGRYDLTILRDALKNELNKTVWFLQWCTVWSLKDHANAQTLLSDPIVINRGEVGFRSINCSDIRVPSAPGGLSVK